jgi:capsular polysaccharide biosynthesis protein
VDPNDVFRIEREDEELLASPRDLLRVILRRLWVIVLVPLVFAGLSAGFSLTQTPTYEASVKMLINQEPADGAATDLNGKLQGLNLLIPTVAEAVKSRPVSEGVIQKLNLSTSPQSLQANLKAEPVEETQFIWVSFEDSDPERAQLIANAVGDVLSEQVTELGPDGSTSITATVWESAMVPDSPTSPDLVRNVFLALVLGLMLGLGLAFLINYLDDGLESADEVERLVGVPTFGVVPKFEAHSENRNLRSRHEGRSGSNTLE